MLFRSVPEGEYSDDYLLKNHCGITHISKIPRELKNLDKEESLKGYKRLCEKLKLYEPKLLIFSYKNGLDSILSAVLDKKIKARYGFNPEYDYLFNSAVFVFPMPGTICTKAEAEICFDDLINYLKKEHFVK